jgi:hypothetical protein
MKKLNDHNPIESQNLNPLEERVSILFEEINLAIQWQRPSILFVTYDLEDVRKDVEAALKKRLSDLGQRVCHFQVNKEEFDIPTILSRQPDRDNAIFFITGLRRGGGRGGYNAYRALNMHREYFVENQLRAVFWLKRTEAVALPHHAPDFWSFRHRVIEFNDIHV